MIYLTIKKNAGLKIELQHIEKRFEQETIFKDVNLSLESSDKIAITGINGSGKSTLLQIISGYISPSTGSINYFSSEGLSIPKEQIYSHISISAPYIELIEELNLREFLTYHFTFKSGILPITDIIKLMGLEAAEHKTIEKFSSGMKQRVKLAQALFTHSEMLLLDEPCSNLDENGVELYQNLIKQYAENRLIIVASNEQKEYHFCDRIISINDYKRNQKHAE